MSRHGTSPRRHCNVCGLAGTPIEEAEVRSNVRKFAAESFAVWRCSGCHSIHARDEVDLSRYYADYPLHKLETRDMDWMLRAMYANLRKRLAGAGVTAASSLIDFGCGAGVFLSFLAERGFTNVAGFDEFNERFADRGVLDRRYDCVMSQDVIEHVSEPLDFVGTLDGLCKPGGVIVIGTPNAEAIDLERPEERIHALHQPYHRHILSRTALESLGRDRGWTLLRYYPSAYADTRMPFVNSALIDHYFKCHDNNVDVALEPMKLNRKVCSLRTWRKALFGYGTFPDVDVMAVFRRVPR